MKRKLFLLSMGLYFLALAGVVTAISEAVAGELGQPFVRVEIERDTPTEKQHIVREFNDLEELLMWFQDKVESKTCDPYVTSMKMYPYGKF
jgi:hypothetical protein